MQAALADVDAHGQAGGATHAQAQARTPAGSGTDGSASLGRRALRAAAAWVDSEGDMASSGDGTPAADSSHDREGDGDDACVGSRQARAQHMPGLPPAYDTQHARGPRQLFWTAQGVEQQLHP
jgi:hypothetical protein